MKLQRLFTFAWLTWILLAATKRLIRVFPAADLPLNSDAYWTYLPNARKLLADPWGFLSTDPASYHVAPLGYMWPALWGADPARVQLANCLLYLLCLLMLWRCATRLGGLWAGVVATALMAHHPVLAESIPQVLTESIYLFGLLLLLLGATEYSLGAPRRRLWLAMAAAGLSITLLSRPVLQIMALGLLLLCSLLTLLLRRAGPGAAAERARAIFTPALSLALCAALLLPLATVVKNGVYFQLWGMGTGAGAGLSYGLSPYKLGQEPVYGGFAYDASLIPRTVEPATQGHPLDRRSDAILRQSALQLVQQTTLADNAAFFAQKLQAWLFYSTPELRITYKLRAIRLFEWLAIGLGLLLVLARCLRRRPGWSLGFEPAAARLPGDTGRQHERLGLLALLLLAALTMALQLTPVLYNARYNIFFMEPWLMLLAGVGVALLLQPSPALPAHQPPNRWQQLPALLRWALPRLPVLLLLWLLPVSLAQRAQRHESWAMDPYRPGPVEVVLDSRSMGPLQAQGAEPIGPHRWRLTAATSTLQIPLTLDQAQALSPQVLLDAIWRLRLAVQPPTAQAPRSCRTLGLAVAQAYPSHAWFPAPSQLRLLPDGQLHTYAIHGNDQLRPAASTLLQLQLACPPGTEVHWQGAELLRSTLPEAARDFAQQGTPINPYRRSEPLPPQNTP